MSKKNKIISASAAAVVLAAVIVSAALFGGKKEPVAEPPPSQDVSSETPVSDDAADLDGLEEKRRRYPDFVGRINIPNTKLSHDVAQKTDDENAYYLNHRLDGTTDPYGTPFVDYRATVGSDSVQSTILTIYGHNSKNGDYFETVKSYKDIDFYKNNPIIEFDTVYGEGKYKIIGYFTEKVEGDFFNYHDYIDLSEEYFNEYLEKLDARNLYNSGVDVRYGDKLIALSTCNDDLHPALNTPFRDVLVARKVRDDEDGEFDISGITPNTDVIMPAEWRKKYKKTNPYQ